MVKLEFGELNEDFKLLLCSTILLVSITTLSIMCLNQYGKSQKKTKK